jgi:hypothetical protein
VLTQLSRLWRLIHISLVLVRHGLDEVLLATHLFRPLYSCPTSPPGIGTGAPTPSPTRCASARP